MAAASMLCRSGAVMTSSSGALYASQRGFFCEKTRSFVSFVHGVCVGGVRGNEVRCGGCVSTEMCVGVRSGDVSQRRRYSGAMAQFASASSSPVMSWSVMKKCIRNAASHVPQKSVRSPRMARGAASSSSSTSTSSSSSSSSTTPSEAKAEKDEKHEGEAGRSNTASSTTKTSSSSSPVSWLSLGLALVTGTLALNFYEREMKRMKAEKSRNASVSGTGTAKIGGSFTLKTMDEKGRVRTFTDKDLHGRWNLLYFGFTFCPDICPAELEKLCEAVDVLKKKFALDVRPIFLSVDPKRDSPMQVREYCSEFHPTLIGLTGSQQQCEHAARQYRVYYSRTDPNPDGEDDDYLIDHSIITYLVAPDGNFLKFFGKNETSASLADTTAKLIQNWSPNQS